MFDAPLIRLGMGWSSPRSNLYPTIQTVFPICHMPAFPVDSPLPIWHKRGCTTRIELANYWLTTSSRTIWVRTQYSLLELNQFLQFRRLPCYPSHSGNINKSHYRESNPNLFFTREPYFHYTIVASLYPLLIQFTVS